MSPRQKTEAGSDLRAEAKWTRQMASCLPCICIVSYQGKFQLGGRDVPHQVEEYCDTVLETSQRMALRNLKAACQKRWLNIITVRLSRNSCMIRVLSLYESSFSESSSAIASSNAYTMTTINNHTVHTVLEAKVVIILTTVNHCDFLNETILLPNTSRVYFRPLKKGVVLRLAIVKKG